MSGPRIFGIVLALVGVAAAVYPDWFTSITGAPTADVYAAVERRVRGGMLLGFGLGFIAIDGLRPWSVSIPSVVFYFMTGALAMRLVGIVVDGVVPKQWLMVAVETAIMTAAALWLWRSSVPST